MTQHIRRCLDGLYTQTAHGNGVATVITGDHGIACGFSGGVEHTSILSLTGDQIAA